MSRPVGLAVATLGLLAGACADETPFVGGELTKTSISVDPQYFLGDVVCSDAPGGLKSFVATLSDIADDPADDQDLPSKLEGLELPSSPPTPCTEAVQFRLVVPGRPYTAEIAGYEQEPAELVASAVDCKPAPDSGSQHMCTPDADGNPVPASPRWTWDCGKTPPSPVVAIQNSVEPMRSCQLKKDIGIPAPPAVVVDPNATLAGPLACAPAGTIESFDVLPAAGSGLPPFLGVPCATVPPAYAQGVVAGQTLEFRVEAHDVDPAVPTRAARCSVVPEEDVVRTAACEPLSDVGTLRIAPLEQGVQCVSGDLFKVKLDDSPVTGSFPCEEPLELVKVKAGEHEIELTLPGAVTVKCTAEVLALATTTATCTP